MKRPSSPSSTAPSTALVPIVEPADTNHRAALATPRPPVRRPLIDMWLEGRSPRTLAAYKDDLRDFAAFLTGHVTTTPDNPVTFTPDAAAAYLIARTHGEANELALTYRTHLIRRKLAPATVNRRLAALRSLVKLANLLGHVTWQLGVENVKHEKYRETAGPGVEAVRRMIEVQSKTTPESAAKRNVAVLRLLFNQALRRGEVAELRIEHVSIVGTAPGARVVLSILGKGRAERENVTLSRSASDAVIAWLKERGTEPGSLFYLTGHGIWSMVKVTAMHAGLDPKKVRPHGLRHSGITGALDAGSNIRDTMKFSRHKNMNTLQIYDDNRKDVATEVGDLLDAASSKES